MQLDANGRFDASSQKRERPDGVPQLPESCHAPNRWDRRTALSILASSLTGTFAAGCGNPNGADSAQTKSADRVSVPLRILLVGKKSDAEAIQMAWSMTMEQPLAIDVVETDQVDGAGSVTSQMTLADVAIIPQSLLGGIEQSEEAVPISSDALDSYQREYGKPFPAVAEGLGSYGGDTLAVAVGAKLLAVLALDSDVQCETWGDYHQWVTDLGGNAAEPLAPDWAAVSFLNRCASTVSSGWLFDQVTMEPELRGPQYVSVLDQMAATAKLYKSEPKNPREIWQAIRLGKLQGGIGYEVPEKMPLAGESIETDPSTRGEETEQFDISVFNCPVETQTDRLWFGPRTPVASISIGCRQTDASKRFIGWLTGGERMPLVRQQIEGFSKTRIDVNLESPQSTSAYSRWLAERLLTPQVIPGLILPGAYDYHDALDQAVRSCLNGDRTPAEALDDAANAWQSITNRIGRKQQLVAWKKTLGFGI
jgi:hypothetical protein